jgi:hypothetical protein
MKKRTLIALLLVAALSVGSALGVAAAAPSLDETVDDNVVEFTEIDWTYIPTVTPENDDRLPDECDELDPVGSGPFTLTWVPTFDFGERELALDMATIFDVLPARGTAERPAVAPVDSHFVGVQDMRAWAAGQYFTGWTVEMHMYSQFESDDDVLTGALIRFTRGIHASGIDMEGENLEHGDAGLPGYLMGVANLGYGGTITVATAEYYEGHGRTALSFGYGSDVRLDIINRANASVGEFFATIDWVLTAGEVTP